MRSLKESQKWYKRQYDKKARTVPLWCGDLALIHFPQDESDKRRKLSRPWHILYRITAINQPDATPDEDPTEDDQPIHVAPRYNLPDHSTVIPPARLMTTARDELLPGGGRRE